jgi:uncharacterized membrane protein YgaE (UPF0421/DUF939 family)
MKRLIQFSAVQLAVRAGIAAGLAAWIATLVALEHPLYAFISAVIATDLSAAQSRKLGLRRIFATAIGGICGAALSQLLGPGSGAVGLAVFLAMVVASVLGAGEGTRVAGFICGIVVLEHSADPWLYGSQRFIETVLGVVIAWGISFLPRLVNADQD